MIQEALQQLVNDVLRVAEAGAAVAPHDERLRQHAQRLHALSVHVPALEKLAAALDRLTESSSDAAAVPLLDLLVLTRQLCAGLAGAAVVEGALESPTVVVRPRNTVPVISLIPVLDGFFQRATLERSHLTPELRQDCRYQLSSETKYLRPPD
jgi:hypothetical protein